MIENGEKAAQVIPEPFYHSRKYCQEADGYGGLQGNPCNFISPKIQLIINCPTKINFGSHCRHGLQRFFSLNEGVVSKETVVLRRWGSSIQKFGFINGVENVNWPPYRGTICLFRFFHQKMPSRHSQT